MLSYKHMKIYVNVNKNAKTRSIAFEGLVSIFRYQRSPTRNLTPGRRVAVHYITALPRQLLS